MAHEEIETLAKIAERERIGRDLHDLLGHTLSVIVLKSELASKLAENILRDRRDTRGGTDLPRRLGGSTRGGRRVSLGGPRR